jgi:hypothetical protein
MYHSDRWNKETGSLKNSKNSLRSQEDALNSQFGQNLRKFKSNQGSTEYIENENLMQNLDL